MYVKLGFTLITPLTPFVDPIGYHSHAVDTVDIIIITFNF